MHFIIDGISPEGMQNLILNHSSGAKATVFLFGATVTSFKIPNGQEVLFLSKKSYFDHVHSFRGGIPIVFPQFGLGKLPKHGFARNVLWEIQEIDEKGENPRVILQLKSSEKTKQIWDYDFLLTLEITLEAYSLKTILSVVNTDHQIFNFQMLQHTYLNLLNDISQIKISGLKDQSYIDKVDCSKEKKQENVDFLSITEETDRIYINSPDKIKLLVNDSYQVELTKSSHCLVPKQSDLVLWNPWIEKAKSLSDFEDEEYRKMICLEPGIVHSMETLPVGGLWSLTQTLCVYQS